MKRRVAFTAVFGMLIVLSCNKDNIRNEFHKEFGLHASIESLLTKAELNESLDMVWSKGDKIGVYVNDASWSVKNQPFTLKDDCAGTTQGDFNWDNGDFTNQLANAAFFPWQGTGENANNVWDGTMYFKMKDSYYNYTSGQFLAPLVAKMEYDSASEKYKDIAFKYVGGVVKVSFDNLPGAAHSIGMTVVGQQVCNNFEVNPSDAGSCSVAATAGGDSSIWLNYETASTDRSFDFIFPVATLPSNTDFKFQIYDKNGVKIWEKQASNQPAIDRAAALVLPRIATFKANPQGIYLAGYINGKDVYVTNDDAYKFVNNKLSLKLTSDSYVLLNNSDDVRYLASSYIEGANSMVMSTSNTNYNNKLKVPAGDRTFTISYNTDGSMTLSYE